MPISFFHPWFWLGALAIAAPIWLHLRRKQETNLVRFSALRFLDDQPEPRRSPMRLRHLLLFALRVLGLLLLVTGFAWPYLPGLGTVPIRESRVYILDNTLSHQSENGFIKDRDQVLKEINRAGLDLQVGVVELTSVPRVVVAFGDSRDVARQRLLELQPSYQRGAYLAAFRQANTLLDNSLGAKKRIILLGDNQANQWAENPGPPPFLRQVEVDLPKVAATTLPNLSLSEAQAQRVFLGDKSLVTSTVKLTHTGEARTANVTFRVNGQLISHRTVTLENQPEAFLVDAQWEADPGAWLRGEVTVEGKPDVLPADNRVYFSLPPVVEGRVALLALSPYLRLALSPEIMRGQWALHNLEPSSLNTELAANSDADVLCLESNYLQSGDARKLLWRYLTNGRGVLLLVNRVTPAVNGCLRDLGCEVEEVVNASQPHEERFRFIFANHPIFHPFLTSDFGDLTDIRVTKYARLRAKDAMPLVFSERGAPLFFQGTRQPGKLFVIGFGLDREHTSWPVHPTFIPFLDLALQAARADDPTPNNFEPAEIARFQLPVHAAAKEIVLRDNQRELARVPLEQGKALLRLPDKPGLYSVTADGKTEIEKVLSVNPSPKESQLTFVAAPEALKTWMAPRAPETSSSLVSDAAVKVSLAAILRQQLWWWMVLAGLTALALEMLLAELRKGPI